MTSFPTRVGYDITVLYVPSLSIFHRQMSELSDDNYYLNDKNAPICTTGMLLNISIKQVARASNWRLRRIRSEEEEAFTCRLMHLVCHFDEKERKKERRALDWQQWRRQWRWQTYELWWWMDEGLAFDYKQYFGQDLSLSSIFLSLSLSLSLSLLSARHCVSFLPSVCDNNQLPPDYSTTPFPTVAIIISSVNQMKFSRVQLIISHCRSSPQSPPIHRWLIAYKVKLKKLNADDAHRGCWCLLLWSFGWHQVDGFEW